MPAVDLHPPQLGPPGEPCTACAAPLAGDQRYCLGCGERRGPARLDVLAMARGNVIAPFEPPATSTATPAASRSAIALPTPRAIAAAALLVLGFGIFAGADAGPRVADTVAATGRSTIVVAQAPTPSPQPAPTQESTPAVAESEPAQTESEPTEAASRPAPPSEEPAPDDAGADDPSDEDTAEPAAEEPRPPIKHVWVVLLTGHTLEQALTAPSPTPYLSELAGQGLVLSEYAAVAKGSLANGIALLSGRKPTDDHERGCPTYVDVNMSAHTGCVYGPDVKTLLGQLTDAGRTWRAYVEGSDVGSDPPSTCRHPAAGSADPWVAPRPRDAYLTQRNPLVYFHAIADASDCATNIASPARLAPDAVDAESAPHVALVVPDACHDGRDQPCTEGAPAGLAAADSWLETTLAPILSSRAYADDGMVVVTFDTGPDDPRPVTERPPVGALVLSEHVEAGARVDTAFTHTSLLRTITDAFELEPLGAAAKDDVKPFGTDVFTR